MLTFISCVASQMDDLDKMPTPVDGIEAIAKNVVYPKEAKEEGTQGKVYIKATIDKEGSVIHCEVKRSVSSECDKAAIEAIKKTKFYPGIKDGKKVKAEVTIPIMFKLN